MYSCFKRALRILEYFFARSGDHNALTIFGASMRVGDLVRYNGYLAIVICVNAYETLIKWLDDGIVEDADNYGTSLEVISASR